MTTTSMVLGVIGILLSLPAWLYFVRGAARLYRFIRSGGPAAQPMNNKGKRFSTLLREVFLHTEMARKPFVACAHWFVMVGFLIGSLYWFEAYIQAFVPRGGWPIVSSWPIYHFVEEILGWGTVLGILALIGIRIKEGKNNRLDRFYGANARAAHFVEAVVLIEGLGMLAVKAGKIATYQDHDSVWADFGTRYIAQLLPASALMVSIFALIKLLSGMVWLFVVGKQLDWGVAWHRFLAFFNIFFQRNPDGANALGKLAPMVSDGKALTLENTDPDVDKLGMGTLEDASWKTLLDITSCTECGRCQEQCPAWNTEKPLSPKLLITSLRDAALPAFEAQKFDNSHAGIDVLKLVGETGPVTPDVLWSCTNCGACVEQCPVDIEHIDHVANLRRFQVLAESEFPSELTGLFKNLETKGNPWGRNAKERATWVEEAKRDGISVPVFGEDVTSFDDVEFLLWVGCAGAYDDNGRRTSRAIAELLNVAGVKFAVLAQGETCTGDPARRAGNEFLFQMLAAENIETLNGVFEGVPAGQRKIITSCAHCFNTLRNEFPDFDGHYDVLHHTQLLNRLVRDGLLKPIPRSPENRKPITYHDPCFLGRHNKVFDPPRSLLEATGSNLIEMDRSKDTGFCCGAGGARMFMEENLGTRINENRTSEALATGAEEIATGCPFCNTMIDGGVRALSGKAKVNDVAVMLRNSVLIDGQLPESRDPAFLEAPIRALRPKAEPEPEKKPVAPSAVPPGTAAPKPAVPAAPSAPTVTGAAPALAPGSAIPVAQPPAATPPVATPPAAAPPAARPPIAAPPPAAAPVAKPPAAKPPVIPPTKIPPVAAPPAAKPPVARPPAAVPPAAAPPKASPPKAKPPKATPPKAALPTAQPPIAKPPVAQPPAGSDSDK